MTAATTSREGFASRCWLAHHAGNGGLPSRCHQYACCDVAKAGLVASAGHSAGLPCLLSRALATTCICSCPSVFAHRQRRTAPETQNPAKQDAICTLLPAQPYQPYIHPDSTANTHSPCTMTEADQPCLTPTPKSTAEASTHRRGSHHEGAWQLPCCCCSWKLPAAVAAVLLVLLLS